MGGYELSLDKLKVKFDISNDITFNLQSNDTGMLAGDLLRDMLKNVRNSGTLPYCRDLTLETGLWGISVKTKDCLDVQMPYSLLYEGKGNIDLKLSVPPVQALLDLVTSSEHDSGSQQMLSFETFQHNISGDARVGGSLGLGFSASLSVSVCFFSVVHRSRHIRITGQCNGLRRVCRRLFRQCYELECKRTFGEARHLSDEQGGIR